MKRTILLVSCGLFFGILLCELLLRVFVGSGSKESSSSFVRFMKQQTYTLDDPEGKNPLFRKSADPSLGWEPIPNSRWGEIRINAAGCRGREFSPQPDPKITRIAFLGDSETFARRLKEDEAVPGRLEEILNEGRTPPQYEVINFGVIGYNTAQEFALIQKKAIQYQPSIVVLYYVFNDPEISTPISFAENSLLKRSYLYQFAIYSRLSLKTLTDVKKQSKDNVDYYLRLHDSIYFDATQQILKDMAQYLKERNVRFFLLIGPEIAGVPDLQERYPYHEIHRKLASLAAANLSVVDPLTSLARQFKDPKELWVTEFDPHKNSRANEVIAHVLARAISK